MWNKILGIFLNAVPIVVMVGLIPFVLNDSLLAGIYILATIVSFVLKREKSDYLAYGFGLIVITISEYFFIQTGVETFVRNSLFGIMPIWLPLLWAYAFVAITRSLRILDR